MAGERALPLERGARSQWSSFRTNEWHGLAGTVTCGRTAGGSRLDGGKVGCGKARLDGEKASRGWRRLEAEYQLAGKSGGRLEANLLVMAEKLDGRESRLTVGGVTLDGKKAGGRLDGYHDNRTCSERRQRAAVRVRGRRRRCPTASAHLALAGAGAAVVGGGSVPRVGPAPTSSSTAATCVS
jgi:hypothetical protein